VIVGMIMVYLLRNVIIRILYTDDFLSVAHLFKWQLLGDFIKFIAIVMSYQFLAKKQMGYYIFTEVLSIVLLYGFSVYFIDSFGTEGIVIAHFVRYVLYLFIVVYLLRSSFIGENRLS
jgi:PST family polysaccharide transporter